MFDKQSTSTIDANFRTVIELKRTSANTRCSLRSNRKLGRRFSTSPSYTRSLGRKDSAAIVAKMISDTLLPVEADYSDALPPENEVTAAFEAVLNKMDLPPDKIRILRSYDLNKKWGLVQDQRNMYNVTDPSVYLEKLALYLNKKASKKKKKLLGDETSTEILKHIEISLRTNSIDWVRSFLNENNGLRVLVEYLTQLLEAGGWGSPSFIPETHEVAYGLPSSSSSLPPIYVHANVGPAGENAFLNDDRASSGSIFRRGTSASKKSLKNVGDREDDVHVCVSCLRAIMNDKCGFSMVFNDPQAIYCIARSILHQSLRTKALVLELLAAICLVSGGHELIIKAFNRFRQEYNETHRFQHLYACFSNPSEFHVDFMTSCMQFFNIVVHSADSMNYRSYLQYGLTLLGLDEYLEVLKKSESEQLQEQITAYLDNKIDVAFFMEEAVRKVEVEADNSRLKEDLSKANERLQEVEADYIARMAQLDRRLKELNGEKEKLLKDHDFKLDTMRRTLNEKDRASREQQAKLESKIQELERMQANMQAGLNQAIKAVPPTVKSSPSPPPPPPGPHQPQNATPSPSPQPQSSNSASVSSVPPPAPPLPCVIRPPLAPPPLGKQMLAHVPGDVMTIKKVYSTRNKLPLLNWCALKPNQAKDTVFSKLDDEKIMDKIDFTALEDMFKIGSAKMINSPEMGAAGNSSSSAESAGSSMKKNTLLDTKRLQNIAITCRKLSMSAQKIMSAVHRMDLEALPAENVDILLKIAPTQEEMVKYKDYDAQRKCVTDLSDEDQFLSHLVKIERFEHKIKIMSFMATFDENADLLEPQFVNLTAASKCVREATKFHKLLEVVLAYGNYMNGVRKGSVYGFKVSSLDVIYGLKSPVERTLSLLHLIADTVSKSFPDLLDFSSELKFADKASGIIWEAVIVDMRELESNFALAKKERELKGSDCPTSLVSFLDRCEQRISKLQSSCKTATDAFSSCVEYYGESSRTEQPHTFFSRLLEFSKRFKQAVADNNARSAAEQRSNELSRRDRVRRRLKNGSDESLISELEQRLMIVNGDGIARAKKQKSKYDSSQINDGDFERIMNGLKEGAYVTFDGPQNIKRYSASSTSVKRAEKPPPTEPKPSSLREARRERP